nr:hypothetical protein [Tanacetum cinerariifolium]
MANPNPEDPNVLNEDVLEEDPYHLLDYDEEEDPEMDIEEEEPEEDLVEEPEPLAGHGDHGSGGAGGSGGTGGNPDGTSVRGARPTVSELIGCTYATFIKCDPLPFNGIEGAVGMDIDGYTNRFHELALLCPRMVEHEAVKVEQYL